MVSFSTIFAGVNCTKDDLDALTNSKEGVQLVDFDNDLVYEKTYK